MSFAPNYRERVLKNQINTNFFAYLKPNIPPDK